jgi:hypothetical protein
VLKHRRAVCVVCLSIRAKRTDKRVIHFCTLCCNPTSLVVKMSKSEDSCTGAMGV